MNPLVAATVLNGQLAYLAWLWTVYGLGRPIEIRISLCGLQESPLPGRMFGAMPHSVVDPAGMAVNEVTHHIEITAHELGRPGNRHQIVRAFCDRLHQAYGESPSASLFEMGHLYGGDGRPTRMILVDGNIWDLDRKHQRATVYDDGVVTSVANGEAIGYEIQGAIVDLNGDTVAVLTFAPSRACPTDFLPLVSLEEQIPNVGPANAGAHPNPPPAIALSGNWGPRTFREILDDALDSQDTDMNQPTGGSSDEANCDPFSSGVRDQVPEIDSKSRGQASHEVKRRVPLSSLQ